MSRYGNGVSLVDAMKMDEEQIRHALNGELVNGETEKGFTYGEASKKECDGFIISTFKEAAYQAITLAHGGKALETIAEKHGLKIDLQEYMQEKAKIDKEYHVE